MTRCNHLIIALLLTVPASAQTLIPQSGDAGRPQIDIESYSIDVRIDPFEGELLGSVEIRFIQLDRQNYAVFDLDRRLRVRDVYLGEDEPLPVRFRQFDLDSTLEVDLSDLGQFDQPLLRIEYDGVLDPEEGRREPILARISNESAFLLYESKWFPTNGLYRDLATMKLDLKVPSSWEVITTLPGVESDVGELEKLLSFYSDSPVSSGTIVAGDYETVLAPSDGEPRVEVLAFKDIDVASEISKSVAEMFHFYENAFGPAVEKSFRMIEIAGANWDARSAPGMLMLGSDELGPGFDPWVLSRYVAAQWFPLKYPIGEVESDAWLADGMAVFAGMMYFEETLPPFEADEYVQRTMVKALTYEGDTPISQADNLEKDSSEYRAVVGFKGGFIIRMLRDVMGKEKFDEMLKEFPVRFADRPLSTSEFFDLSSQLAEEDLTYFFDQWLNSSGVPEFSREYTIFSLQDGYKITGQINQDLDLFRMPVEIEVETDVEPEYHRVWVSGPSSDFDLITERKPQSVSIDPNKRLLRLSPDIRVAVYISRGEDYADSGRHNEAIDEYQLAIDEDRLSSLAFFRMGEALLELGNLQASANVFREALNGNLDPVWVEVWSYLNLGKIFDIRGDRDRALGEYQKAINTGDDAYGAQDEAERYINAPFRRSGRTIG